MNTKVPYQGPESRKGPGRPLGGKNPPGHKAGRPKSGNGQRKTRAPRTTKLPYQAQGTGGNGGQHRTPLTPPSKPLPPGGHMPKLICQSEMNPELITPEQLIKEVQYLAVSDIIDWPDCPAKLREAPESFRKCISSVQIHLEKDIKGQPLYDKDGNLIYGYKITLWNKSTAQDQLNRWHGNYAKDKTPVNVNQFNQFNQMNAAPRMNLKALSVQELQKLEELIAKAEAQEIIDVASIDL